MQIWSASRHALATNRTSISISVAARVHRAQQLQVLTTDRLGSSRFEPFQAFEPPSWPDSVSGSESPCEFIDILGTYFSC